ncbi:MAG: DUF2298 domain-containing protein, partial [Anaerolineales bacterium]
MVVWGMGLPLGLLAWAGLGWAAWRSFKAGDSDAWRAHLLPLVWAGGYFLFMGTRWVKSVRYFLPIYPFMALFAAWALVELWRIASRQLDDRRATTDDRILSVTVVRGPWSAVHLAVAALAATALLSTLAWAWGFSSIYRTPAGNTRIQASRWIYQNIPAPFNLHVQLSDGQPYVEPLPAPEGLEIVDVPYPIQFEAHVTGSVTGFTVGHARSAFDDLATGTLHVILATDPAGTQPLAEADLRVEPVEQDPRGESFSAPLGPAQLQAGQTYYLLVTAPSGGPIAVAGSTVSNESWDEGLPLRVDERDGFGGLYRGLTMEARWQDTEDKRQMILDTLAQADYLFLPSQRAMWSASRLPMTYPMTMEYYRALFDGRLGFELAAQFQSPIRIGPLQISDVAGTWAWGRAPDLPAPGPDFPFNNSQLAAEEAFSVYDHAPVWIFRKRPDFDLEKARAVLNAIDLSTVMNLGPREATRVPTLLRLPPNRLAEQRTGGTWSEMFNPDSILNRSQFAGVIVWWLAVLTLGWIAFPLTSAVFGGFADKGYPLAKTVALLFVAWFAWILGSFQILPFTRATIALGVGVLAILSGVIVWLRRADLTTYLRTHLKHILVIEGVTLALFVFDLLIRLGNPDLWHPYYGGEKPMVFSFFNAVLKSTSFPPYNPWLAGYYLNYYYYGFVLVAVLVKLLGIIPTFAYNLILPTLFALTGINAFCVAYNLVARGQKSEVGSQKSEVGSRKSEGESSTLEWQVEEAESRFAESEIPSLESEAPTQTLTPSSNSISSSAPQSGPPSRVAAPRSGPPSPYLAGVAAALLIVVLGNLAQVRT